MFFFLLFFTFSPHKAHFAIFLRPNSKLYCSQLRVTSDEQMMIGRLVGEYFEYCLTMHQGDLEDRIYLYNEA